MRLAADDPAAVQQARELMERQVQQLGRLVEDLLDVSRMMRDKIELRKERVELAAVVARGVETARPVVSAYGHELAVSLPPSRCGWRRTSSGWPRCWATCSPTQRSTPSEVAAPA